MGQTPTPNSRHSGRIRPVSCIKQDDGTVAVRLQTEQGLCTLFVVHSVDEIELFGHCPKVHPVELFWAVVRGSECLLGGGL